MVDTDRPERLEWLRRQLADVETQRRPAPGRQHLKAESELDEPEFSSEPDEKPDEKPDEDMRAAQQQAKAVCLRLLAESARPRANLEAALRKRDFEPKVIASVLDRFTEVGLIDDQAYANAYVRSKQRERGLARRALAAELRSKGITPDVAGPALEQVDRHDEEERAEALVRKRLSTASASASGDREGVRRRMLGMLARRGYPADLALRVIDRGMDEWADAASRVVGDE